MRYIIFVTALFFLCNGKAQEGFIKAYNFGYPTAIRFNSILLDESELVLSGYIKDSIPPYQQGVLFSKIDTLGTVIDFKVYYDLSGVSYASSGYPGEMIKLQDDSGYLLTGNILEGEGGFIMKFNLEGDLLWMRKYEDDNALQGYYKKIIETQTGYLIAGRKQMAAGGQGDIFLMKTDKEGNKLWEQTYGLTSRNDQVDNLLKINNNEYILGGNTGPNQGTPWQQWHRKLQIFAVDSLGNEKWVLGKQS